MEGAKEKKKNMNERKKKTKIKSEQKIQEIHNRWEKDNHTKNKFQDQ